MPDVCQVERDGTLPTVPVDRPEAAGAPFRAQAPHGTLALHRSGR